MSNRKIYDLEVTEKMLTGDNFPQIQILDKLYVVDNRHKTFKKIQEIQADEKIKDMEKEEKIFTLALGEKAYKEIEELDLSQEKYTYLTFCVMAAITGEDPKEMQEMAKKQTKN